MGYDRKRFVSMRGGLFDTTQTKTYIVTASDANALQLEEVTVVLT